MTDIKAAERFLAEGLKEMHLTLGQHAQEKLLQFLILLQKWNQHYNLTAITDLFKMVSYHLLDSLAIAPFITAERILDVGSGAGFPGIPLAIYSPHQHWTLLDSNGKKIRFLNQAKIELSLTNVTIVQSRAERWQTHQKFPIIVSRAVGSAPDIIQATRHLLEPNGQWFFLKSEYSAPEFNPFEEATSIKPLHVPGVINPRFLIILNSAKINNFNRE